MNNNIVKAEKILKIKTIEIEENSRDEFKKFVENLIMTKDMKNNISYKNDMITKINKLIDNNSK